MSLAGLEFLGLAENPVTDLESLRPLHDGGTFIDIWPGAGVPPWSRGAAGGEHAMKRWFGAARR